MIGSTNIQINEDTVKTRMKMYEEATAPVLDFFRDLDLNIVMVDGMQSMDIVFHQIENVL